MPRFLVVISRLAGISRSKAQQGRLEVAKYHPVDAGIQ
jgi:hypothetical protein